MHHIRKGDNVSDKPNKFDIRGASAITDMVDNVFIVFRNKAKELARKENKKVDPLAADTILMCEKQRNGEYEEHYHLWYHKDSQQFIDDVNGVPMAFDAEGGF